MNHLDAGENQPRTGLGPGVFRGNDFDRPGLIEVERPLRDVEVMRADVGEPAAGILAIRTPRGKMVVDTARAERGMIGPRGRVTEPQVPVEPGLHGLLLQIAPAAGSADPDANRLDLANAPAADQFARQRKFPELAGPLLAAGLEHALVL